jgi:hypothetical protein
MPLRPSQVETLKVVSWRPRGVSAYVLAWERNIKVASARADLEDLGQSGHLEREGDFFYLTQLGREALEGR